MSVLQFGQALKISKKRMKKPTRGVQQFFSFADTPPDTLDGMVEKVPQQLVSIQRQPIPINLDSLAYLVDFDFSDEEDVVEEQEQEAEDDEEEQLYTLEPTSSKRILLDEPAALPQPSRDFRILPAHAVGTGSLHEKAKANIAAIQLLKQLEAENREATEEEKAVLVRYSGWGALANVFEYGYSIRAEYKTVAAQLKELLTPEEFEAARATTPNAHYTSPQVIRAIWQALEHMGVQQGAEVLEPAIGIGHFFGLQPDTLMGGHRTGVEIDPTTARIAQHLYPDTTIFAKGFEETTLPDNYMDIIVGNVPFGDYSVHDPSIKNAKHKSSIHNYFFVKSLAKLRPGGIAALITSRYTMDSTDSSIRRHLASQADLIGAIRLPNTAFKGNAGTEVTTDILFLQKRAAGDVSNGVAWVDTNYVAIDEDSGYSINEYYTNHPEMLLGELTLKGTMYRGNELTLSGELTDEGLQRVIALLPQDVYIPRAATKRQKQAPVTYMVSAESYSGVKDGAYTEIEGNIFVREGAILESTSLPASQIVRIRGLIQIRDAVREVFKTQLEDASSLETIAIVTARARLTTTYDRFVRQYGPITSRENSRAFASDPDLPLLLSLENYDPDTKTATKTAIFTQRTLQRYQPVEHVETAQEALAICLNERGEVDWQHITRLTGTSLKQAEMELEGMVYCNPDGVRWETADEYLSGNVRAKLKAAQAAVLLNPIYEANVTALQAVQPEDLLPGDIAARLGASWIPASDIVDFIRVLFNPDVDLNIRPSYMRPEISVTHAKTIASWKVHLNFDAKYSVGNTTTWATDRLHADDLIEYALNMKAPTVYDTLIDETRVVNQAATIAAREMQQKIKDRFAVWLWEDPDRAARLARYYNDTFNNIRLRTYNGSHLTFPAMNRVGLRNNDLDRHQKDAVWRVLQNKNTLLGHCVGAGKTLEMIASCMELKRLGLASKPMIVVPNHLVEQWGTAFLAAYPQANLFVAGKDAFSTGNRQKAMARIATGTYDAVIISHKSFELLPVLDATYNRFLDAQIDELEDAMYEAKREKGDNRSIVKALERAKQRLKTKIADRAKRESKDDGVTWEQLGIDRIFVDESDTYKNLGFVTKMDRIAGLASTESNRALDMYMKTRYVTEQGGGIVFATGTPISNTMAEMFTLMRYLAPDILADAEIAHFDAWAANFGEVVTALEIAPDGSGYRMHTRFARFVNLPELLTMFHTFADIQTAKMLNLPTPKIIGGKPTVVVSPTSPALKAYVATLVERARIIHSGGIDPSVDNMLKVVGDGRKAALDMRLVDPTLLHVDNESKVNKAVEQIVRLWKETAENHSAQMVFCDISTPNREKFNVYDEIRKQLLECGVPEAEIAYIHSADTDARKKTLFDNVNAGKVRILLGSTEKMGAGTNAQKRLVALHHLDAPWRPRDIEQREGRILRQGNDNDEISLFRYVTEGSFDAYMWQTLETKANFIGQIMSGAITVRTAEDAQGSTLSFAEIKALASGNPIVMEKVKVDTEVRRLDILRADHANQQYRIAQEMHFIPKQIANIKEDISLLQEDIAHRDAHASEEFSILIGEETFTGKGVRAQAGVALLGLVMKKRGDNQLHTYGEYKGFTILARDNRQEPEEGTQLMYKPDLLVRGTRGTYEANLNPHNAFGSVLSISMTISNLDLRLNEQQQTLARREKELVEYQGQLHKPFEHKEKLDALLLQQQEINSQLDLDKHDTQVVASSSSSSSSDDEKAA